MFSYLLYSLKRRKTANLITTGISIGLVLLVNLYFGNIRSYQRQLTNLAENVPIFCQITNLNGTLTNGLFISESTVDALERSAQIKNLSYMTVMMAGEGNFKDADYSKYLNLFVIGANRADAVGELTDDMIHMNTQNIDEFLSSNKKECIVNENVLKKRGWKIGDKITLKCYYYDPASEFNKIEIHPMNETVEVTVAGTMEDISGKTNAIVTDVIIPARTARSLFEQSGLTFFADTVTFHVKNPLQLNAFKKDMLNIGLMETSAEAGNSYTGCALKVRDAHFIASAADLEHAVKLMQSFFPVVCILVLMIGYVVSFLSGNNRKEEYALLRLQGVKKISTSLLFLTEQMILVLIGNIVGDMAVMLISPAFTTMFVVNGVIFSAYLIGAAAAYGQMSKGSILNLLSAQ